MSFYSSRELLGDYTNSSVHSNVFMTFEDDENGILGTSNLGSVCDTNKEVRSNLNNWHENDLTSGLVKMYLNLWFKPLSFKLISFQIVAHEIGHNLGMRHDFDDDTGAERLDSSGWTCTNIGGVMDRNQVW